MCILILVNRVGCVFQWQGRFIPWVFVLFMFFNSATLAAGCPQCGGDGACACIGVADWKELSESGLMSSEMFSFLSLMIPPESRDIAFALLRSVDQERFSDDQAISLLVSSDILERESFRLFPIYSFNLNGVLPNTQSTSYDESKVARLNNYAQKISKNRSSICYRGDDREQRFLAEFSPSLNINQWH